MTDFLFRPALAGRALLRRMRRVAEPPLLRDAGSILVVRFDEIGDFVLNSAFLRELRRNAPRARITLAVQRSCRELAEACPHVDAVIVRRAEGLAFTRSQAAAQRRSILRQNFARLFSRPYDLILVPRRGPDYYGAAFFAYTSGTGWSIGLRDEAVPAHLSGFYFPQFLDLQVSAGPVAHESESPLRIIGRLGGSAASADPEIWLGSEDRLWAGSFIARHFQPGRPVAVVHPSGGHSRLKAWPPESFAEVVAQLSKRHPALQWLVVGGAEEAAQAARVAAARGVAAVNAAGATGLRQLAALLSRSALFVGGDSGVMHLAAAAGTPVVAVFGSTSEIRFRPKGPRAEVVSLRLPCSPDRDGSFDDRCKRCIYPEPRCLLDLGVGAVLEACERALGEAA